LFCGKRKRRKKKKGKGNLLQDGIESNVLCWKEEAFFGVHIIETKKNGVKRGNFLLEVLCGEVNM
jgi:hypothetical protein